MDSHYDQAGDFYLDLITAGLADERSMTHLSAQAVLQLAGDAAGKAVCDIACGEGHLSRLFAQRGAHVTGIDLSANLLEHARVRSASHSINFIRDDAQQLSMLQAGTFDVAICNMALMDIPDMLAVYRAAHRILNTDGRFVFSVLHPCFETPFHVPESHIQHDAQGNFDGFIVRRYADEGHWNSGGTGMRGKFGAYHRTLSTYINGLVETGFQLTRIAEPRLPHADYQNSSHQLNSRVGQILVVAAEK
jgi:SAM-dependent methyltransferase